MHPNEMADINMPAPPDSHSTARLGAELWVDQFLQLLLIIVLLFYIKFVV